MTALEPALGLLSALTSLPAALYYARAFGAAAVRPVRDEHGRISGLRQDGEWSTTLCVFVGGLFAVVIGGAAADTIFDGAMSTHAAFGGLLAGALWPRLDDWLARGLVVFILVGIGAACLLVHADLPAAVAAGYGMGLTSAWCCTGGWRARPREETVLERITIPVCH